MGWKSVGVEGYNMCSTHNQRRRVSEWVEQWQFSIDHCRSPSIIVLNVLTSEMLFNFKWSQRRAPILWISTQANWITAQNDIQTSGLYSSRATWIIISHKNKHNRAESERESGRKQQQKNKRTNTAQQRMEFIHKIGCSTRHATG